MQNIIEKIREVEQLVKDEQARVQRGPGGQELSKAATDLRTARLFLQDALIAPATTSFTK